jgi:hypothetical protein
LLIEVLEREQKAAQSRRDKPQASGDDDNETRRREILARLLWNARLGCATPMPADAELREIGSYA